MPVFIGLPPCSDEHPVTDCAGISCLHINPKDKLPSLDGWLHLAMLALCVRLA